MHQQSVLTLENVTLRFGGVVALDDVSFAVHAGEIFAVIGPNGAGKTSLLNSISGLYRPQHGSLRLHGRPTGTLKPSGESEDSATPSSATHEPEAARGAAAQDLELRRTAPHVIAKAGIARSFQNIELFRHMTVLDNLMLGRHVHLEGGVVSCGLFWGRQRKREIEHREVVEEIIDFLEIESLRHAPVGKLAYGLQKRVELARALALSPRLLLLDEPMAGMNAEEKEDMARFILDINEERGITTVLIEHDMGVVMDLSDRVAVLDFGRLIAVGTPSEVSANPEVISAYLGQAHGDTNGAESTSGNAR